jgi:hypothetical protein
MRWINRYLVTLPTLAVLLSAPLLSGEAQAIEPVLAGAAGATAAAPGPAAPDLRGFWSRDDARAWDKPVNPNSSRMVVYHDYPQMVDRVREDELAAQARQAAEARIPELPNGRDHSVNTEQNQQVPGAYAQPGQEAPKNAPLSRDQILAKYGAPEDAQIVRAQKDSPPAMQGLFEALNSNDKELAFRYAVALARRQAEMQKVVSKATDYQILAMEAIGIRPAAPLPDDGEAIDPIRAEVQKYYEETRQAELRNGAGVVIPEEPGLEQLDANPLNSGKMATAARQEIPVDPEGQVKVLIFLDETAADAAEIAEKLKPLRAKYQSDPKFALFGLTKRTYSLSGLKKRSAEISFPFPLVSGEALAIDLRIQGYPTTIFVAATTKETYRVPGVPSAEEVQRVVGVMRGAAAVQVRRSK